MKHSTKGMTIIARPGKPLRIAQVTTGKPSKKDESH